MTTEERERLAKRFEDQARYLRGEGQDQDDPSALVHLVRAEVYLDAAKIVREWPALEPACASRFAPGQKVRLLRTHILAGKTGTIAPGLLDPKSRWLIDLNDFRQTAAWPEDLEPTT